MSVSCMFFCLQVSVPYCFQMSYGLQLEGTPPPSIFSHIMPGTIELQSVLTTLPFASTQVLQRRPVASVLSLHVTGGGVVGAGQQVYVIDSTPPLPHIAPGSRLEMTRFFCAHTSVLRIL